MKYRKKPVVVEAMQYKKGNIAEIHKFMHKHLYGNIDGSFSFGTLEGTMTAHIGDYIVKGIQGELYPCKPDIFEQTYELVE